ncbi:MAG: 16S rRNA (cytosine(967)-C(5))-methyltransferase RsmB [Ruminiclostridium sp.]|nr:16S rRNA (cytosine(967)-C(5))-methyltransferase RsmB [Ruminiclostridium sp.]
MNGRESVLSLLARAQTDGSYSNLALDAQLSRDKSDRAFVTALFYGVVERRMTLDHVIRTYSKTEFDDIENDTLQLLRMGIYQLMYMDIPESAAVNETVKLAPQRSKGFVNAVLRAFIRGGKQIRLDTSDRLSEFSVRYSCARWIVKMWCSEYGEERTEQMLSSTFGRPPVYARVNTTVCDADDLIYELAEDGVKADRYNGSDTCVVLENFTGIEHLRAYKNGLFHVQDLSSQLCCEALAPQPGETVIDMCAAPGGKTFTLAELMNNSGTVLSSDLYESRVSLIKQGAQRLGLGIVTARVSDASVYDGTLPQADRVLCDVPCSGLGVIRRKPEIKYKRKDEISGLPEIQKRIINNAKNYVRPGGRLVYSTCTLNRAENEDIAERFAEENKDFALIRTKTYIPGTSGGDGFFTAVFDRKK